MTLRPLAALLLAALAVAPPARAQPADPARNDLRCVIAVGLFGAQTKEEGPRAASATGLIFFMGRLKGREPGIDLKARVLAEANLLKSPADLQPDIARCTAEMQAFGRESTELGEALTAFARAKARAGG